MDIKFRLPPVVEKEVCQLRKFKGVASVTAQYNLRIKRKEFIEQKEKNKLFEEKREKERKEHVQEAMKEYMTPFSKGHFILCNPINLDDEFIRKEYWRSVFEWLRENNITKYQMHSIEEFLDLQNEYNQESLQKYGCLQIFADELSKKFPVILESQWNEIFASLLEYKQNPSPWSERGESLRAQRFIFFCFEREEDAMYFKLTWGVQ